jgi:hypothetical protein
MTSQLPEKIKKSVAVVETGLNQLKAQEERVMERLRQEEAKHATEVQRVKVCIRLWLASMMMSTGHNTTEWTAFFYTAPVTGRRLR